MKKLILFCVSLWACVPTLRADEGMWFLMFIERLNGRDMQKLGLQLTPAEIYSINQNSLKDAIVQFNGGCTASIISSNGLLLTNHHCGYPQIAELSTPEHNYLRDGYWAADKSQELSPKSLYVRFFVRMDDVTQRMLSVVNDQMTEKEREVALNREIAKIQKENDQGGKYVVSVRPFFQGNEYYYFVYQDFKDVRFVGTPPESVGKFGGDTDNWEWPRQTGDFSMFRVYTAPDGSAAPYAKENIPLQTQNYLKVNLSGVQENDYAMILGYPGRTNRWESSFWVDQKVQYAYPAWVEGSKTAMDAMKTFMDSDTAIRLKYASKYAQIANYWKNRQGMIDALSAHKTADAKRSAEKKFARWAKKRKNRDTYAHVLPVMQKYFEQTNASAADQNYLMTLLRATDFVGFPFAVQGSLGEVLQKLPQEERRKIFQEKLQSVYDEADLAVEKAVFADGLKLYAQKAYNPPAQLKEINQKYNGDFRKYINETFQNSVFASKERFADFVANFNLETAKNDPLARLATLLMQQYLDKSEATQQLEDTYAKAYRTFVKGMRASGISPILYPDANSTLRLTYGSVKALPADPRNPVKINNHTTFQSMIAKYKPNDPEFDMPQRMIQMYEAKDFGRYLDKDGTMHVNFLTNNDITGGNSGSPVMNGKGELIGLAFDGNIEAMAGDVIFDKKLQRTINVDIRYVLWLIDKFAGATHIVNEMTIVP